MNAQKIAFCFPGQGSLEAGMGREIAEAVPAAMEVFERGSEASGLDLVRLCFEAPREELVETEVQQPALVATSLAVLAALARARHRAGLRRRPLGRRVRRARRRAGDRRSEEAIALVRERGLAMAEAAREQPGLDGRDPRARRRGGRELCRADRRRVAGELQLPRPDRRLRREPVRRRVLHRGRAEGARRTVKLQVSGAFHCPLVARAAERLRPAIERVKFAEPIAPFMSTVTARIEPAQRMARAARRPADGAGAVHAGGPRADARGREDVRRGRPGQRPLAGW